MMSKWTVVESRFIVKRSDDGFGYEVCRENGDVVSWQISKHQAESVATDLRSGKYKTLSNGWIV